MKNHYIKPGAEPGQAIIKKVEPMRINELTNNYYNEYLRHMETKNYSQTTKANYKFSLQKFFKYLESKQTEEVNNDNISRMLEDYQTHLKENGNHSNETINQYITRLKPFLTFCKLVYDIEPIKTEKNRQVKYLKTEEIKEILKTNKEIKNRKTANKLEALICFMFNTGARVKEVTRIKIKDLQVNENNKHIVTIHGKGNKTAVLGVNQDTIEKINIMLEDRENVEPEAPLFIGRSGKPLKERTIQKHFKELAKATDERMIMETGTNPELTKRFTPHSLRHSIAIYLLNVKEKPVNIVKEYLRHESLNTTQHYLRISNKEVVNLGNETLI